MANQLMKQPQTERVIAPGDQEERRRFWIERGNMLLAAEGKGHLHWQCIDGHYWIEERAETTRKAMMANPNYARAA